jgi:hypothetical protein
MNAGSRQLTFPVCIFSRQHVPRLRYLPQESTFSEIVMETAFEWTFSTGLYTAMMLAL